MRLKDRNRAPCVTRGWRDPKTGVFIGWSCRVPWSTFYSMVYKFYTTNKMDPPTEEQVEESICRQIAKGWCTDDPSYHGPVTPQASKPDRPKRGCTTCGKKRR